MYYIYVIQSQKDSNLYIGCTHNIEERLKYHNDGKVRSTKNRRPFILLYHEQYNDKYLAYNKERYYKTAKGKKEIKMKICIQSCGIV